MSLPDSGKVVTEDKENSQEPADINDKEDPKVKEAGDSQSHKEEDLRRQEGTDLRDRERSPLVRSDQQQHEYHNRSGDVRGRPRECGAPSRADGHPRSPRRHRRYPEDSRRHQDYYYEDNHYQDEDYYHDYDRRPRQEESFRRAPRYPDQGVSVQDGMNNHQNRRQPQASRWAAEDDYYYDDYDHEGNGFMPYLFS